MLQDAGGKRSYKYFRRLRKWAVYSLVLEDISLRILRNVDSDFDPVDSFVPGRSVLVRTNLLDTLHVIIRSDNRSHSNHIHYCTTII